MGRGSIKLTLPNLIFCAAFSTIFLRILVYHALSHCDKEYGLIIDAGSSGSRIHIFSWKDDNKDDLLITLNEISALKITPGISSYNTGKDAGKSLVPLIHHAEELIPRHCWSKTNIHLMATAGMRLVKNSRAKEILTGIRNYLSSLPFIFHGRNARIVPGDEEAEFDWLSINFATSAFVEKKDFVGVTDLGGASTQISYHIASTSSFNTGDSDTSTFQPGIRTLQVGAYSHTIYAVSRLHMGLYEAYKNTYKLHVNGQYNENTYPCQIPGDYYKCRALVIQFLNKHASEDMSQLGETANAPPIKTGSTFYGLDNFAKLANIHWTLEKRNPNSRKLPPTQFVNPDMESFQKVAIKLCSMDWYELRSLIPLKAAKDKLLAHSCFGLIYIKILLEDVYKLQDEDISVIFAHTVGEIDGSWATGAAIAAFEKPFEEV